VGSDDYKIYAVDAATGSGKWHAKADNMFISSPVISEGIVTIGSVDGICYTYNAKNGRVRLQFLTNSSVIASPAVSDNIAYFTTSSGFLYAVDIRAKNWFWENKLKVYWNALYIYGAAPKPPPASGYVWSMPLGWNVNTTSSPALSGNSIYLGAGNDLESIDMATQQVQWKFTTGDAVTSSPAIAGDIIYAGSQDGHLYAVDKNTGTRLWDVATGDKITSSPAVSDGTVFVGSHDGTFYAYK
jgi:outer membrane protein assembly factor BamB